MTIYVQLSENRIFHFISNKFPSFSKVFVSCGGLNCGVNMYKDGHNMKFPHPFKHAVAMTIDVVKHKLYVIEKNQG